MKLIKSLIEAQTPNLTDMQKGMLIAIRSSATPLQAYETANGSLNTVAAKDELIRMGLVQQSGNQLQLSNSGQDALVSNNLVDETGTITDEGNAQLEDFENNKTEFVGLESFDMFKSFYQ
jgi:hypothetical protein